jgi:hypothetical protein
MCLEANRDLTHSEMQSVVAAELRKLWEVVETEYRLPNGRIADIFAECNGMALIVEVKTSIKTSIIQEVYRKYSRHCDYLVIASPFQLEDESQIHAGLGWADFELKKIGRWFVSWHEITALRSPALLR